MNTRPRSRIGVSLDLAAKVTSVDKDSVYEFIIDANDFEWTASYLTNEFAVKPETSDYLSFNVLSITSKGKTLTKSEEATVEEDTFYVEDSCRIHMNHTIADDDLIVITLKFNSGYDGEDNVWAYFRNWQV